MGRGGFKELVVWQRSKDLAVQVYRHTSIGSFLKDYGLTDQMRRSSISIPSNIAEGDQRETDKEAVRFFYMAKGSAAELNTQVIIAHEIGYLPQETFTALENQCVEIMNMLAKLISVRSKTFNQKPKARS
jgi:four helix bundle protein